MLRDWWKGLRYELKEKEWQTERRKERKEERKKEYLGKEEGRKKEGQNIQKREK
jgi:hypothetical protein